MQADDEEHNGSAEGEPPTAAQRVPVRRPWLQGTGAVLALLLVAGVAIYWYLRGHADQIVRRRMIATLQARFQCPVELDHLHLSVRHGINLTGTGLNILSLAGPPHLGEDGHPMQPTVLHVPSFRFSTTFGQLFLPTTRIIKVYADGLELDIPPSGTRGWRPAKKNGPPQPPGATFIDQVFLTNSKVVIAPKQPGASPTVLKIGELTLKDVGERQPLLYTAVVTNPKPVGEIHATGHFGPWVPAAPRNTTLDGNYSFVNVDLGSLRGMGGTLSSSGSFTGILCAVTVTGDTESPDLTLAISEHPVPVKAHFVGEVDATTGNTVVKQLDAHVLHSELHAVTSVMRAGTPAVGVVGHTVEVTVTAGASDHARIEDMLLLASKKAQPFMHGAMATQMHVLVPATHASLLTNVHVTGWMKIHGATFENPKFQQTVNTLSGRADKRKPIDGVPSQAQAEIEGSYDIAGGIVRVPTVTFVVPGAKAALQGQYRLGEKTVNFNGTLRTEASASGMTTGWKSLLLMPVDPFLRKDGAGMQIPVTVTGPQSAMKFSVDLKRLLH